jgi:FIMAH domain-containing protein
MKLLLVALTLLVLGLIAPVPARAQMDQCSHDATIQSLRTCVQHAAAEGHIDNQGVTRSLLAKLDAAEAAQGRGQPEVALNLLEAFVREVRAQSGKHILQEHAEHLLMHAQMVIRSLDK